MDRARYHVALNQNLFYPSKASKCQLRDWLESNGIPYQQDALKQELRELAEDKWDPPPNIIEKMAVDQGLLDFGYPHRILFLPPYHPEYNGIELAWASIKYYCGQNPDYNIKALMYETLPKAFKNLNKETA